MWNIVEVLSFGDFIKLFELYYELYPENKSQTINNLLWPLKFIRNASAHNNCLLNTLRKPYTHTHLFNGKKNIIEPNKKLVSLLTEIPNISKNTRKKKIANPIIHDFIATLFLFNEVCSSPILKEKQLHILQDLINTVGNEIGEELGNETIKSKYNGRVSDIDIFYNVPFETLSPSLQDLITKYNKNIEARRNELIKYGIHPASIRLKPIGQQKETKINATEFNGVLITFYVTHKDKMTIGDKLTYSVALKGIITKVSDDEHAPFSEFRPNDIIDGINSANGVCDRLTIDVFYQLYANKLLIELGRWIHDEWKK